MNAAKEPLSKYEKAAWINICDSSDVVAPIRIHMTADKCIDQLYYYRSNFLFAVIPTSSACVKLREWYGAANQPSTCSLFYLNKNSYKKAH